MALVAGVDSSTQACKVVVRDADTGALVREGRAPHPDGTEVDPVAWGAALDRALAEAGGLDDVAAIAVGGQQHGMVCLDDDGAGLGGRVDAGDERHRAAHLRGQRAPSRCSTASWDRRTWPPRRAPADSASKSSNAERSASSCS